MNHQEFLILAYTAGLFDGEGSIVIGVSPPNPKYEHSNPNHWLQVGITNTDKQLIDWLHNYFGGHISDNSHSPSRKNQRPCWAWCVMSNQAMKFLQSILPYLQSKKAQAELAIEFQAIRKKGKITTEILRERDAYKQLIASRSKGRPQIHQPGMFPVR